MLVIIFLTFLSGALAAKEVRIVDKFNKNNVIVPMVVYVTIGQEGIIPLPIEKKYRRLITNVDDQINDEQVVFICNDKNKRKSCGHWKSVLTKNQINSGTADYDTKLKALVVQNMTRNDLGVYMTDNRGIKYTYVMEKMPK